MKENRTIVKGVKVGALVWKGKRIFKLLPDKVSGGRRKFIEYDLTKKNDDLQVIRLDENKMVEVVGKSAAHGD